MAKDQTATPATHIAGPLYVEAADPAQTDFTALNAAITALTDNSGGTAADTIAVIGATYTQAEVANAVASLATKVNELRSDLEALKERII